VVAYVLGSVPFAYLVSRRAGVDILSAGNGNPGADNVFRSVGPAQGITVFLLDALKGASAVMVARKLGVAEGLLPLVSLGAVLGHWSSVFLRFRGGVGLAACIGCCVAISPLAGGAGLGAGLLALPVTRSTSYAAAIGFIAFMVAAAVTGAGWFAMTAAAGLGGIVLARHMLVESGKKQALETQAIEG
jgi:acyl phosphate:glycerol-3-phosphate acyltransferase